MIKLFMFIYFKDLIIPFGAISFKKTIFHGVEVFFAKLYFWSLNYLGSIGLVP